MYRKEGREREWEMLDVEQGCSFSGSFRLSMRSAEARISVGLVSSWGQDGKLIWHWMWVIFRKARSWTRWLSAAEVIPQKIGGFLLI